MFRIQDEIPVVPIEHMSRRKVNYAQQNGGVPGKKVSRHEMTKHAKQIDPHLQFSLALKNPPMTEVTNKLNIDPSLLSTMVQLTDKMKVDLQQVTSRMNVLEQKVKPHLNAIFLELFSSVLSKVSFASLKLSLTGVLFPSHSHHHHQSLFFPSSFALKRKQKRNLRVDWMRIYHSTISRFGWRKEEVLQN